MVLPRSSAGAGAGAGWRAGIWGRNPILKSMLSQAGTRPRGPRRAMLPSTLCPVPPTYSLSLSLHFATFSGSRPGPAVPPVGSYSSLAFPHQGPPSLTAMLFVVKYPRLSLGSKRARAMLCLRYIPRTRQRGPPWRFFRGGDPKNGTRTEGTPRTQGRT